MQKVSQKWKDNQNKTLVSESDIELSLKLTDPDAYEDATAEDNGHIEYSDTNYVVADGDKNIHPYATLERNLWLLDGSREILPDNDYGSVGYVGSEFCGTDRVFTNTPVVSISFSQIHSNVLQGITVRWSEFLNEYAEEFVVTAYNGDTVVATKTITDNESVLSIVQMDIVNYDKITIDIIKWSMPYRRARIDEIFIGILHIYSKKSIFSYNCSQNVDPISAELPKAEVSFSVDNLDGSYNPYNNKGLSKYLMERQEINVKYGYKLDTGYEWISGGKYYISEWNAEQNGMSADFKARDLLEFMTGTYHKGLYNPNGTSLYDLAEDVLQDANLPLNSDGSVKWVIDERLKDIYTIAPLPIDTHANCLQMIANAGESVIYQNRQGTLRIQHRGNTLNSIIGFDDYKDVGWGIQVGTIDILNTFNALSPGKYEISFTSTLTATYDNFSENDSSVVRFDYNNNTYDYFILTWGENSGIGYTKSARFPFELTQDKLDIGLAGVTLFGCRTPDWASSGLSTISNLSFVEITNYNISYFNSYSKSELSLSKPLKQVDVPLYNYSVATEQSELFKGILNVNGTTDVIITYSGAAANVLASVTGGTLNSATYYTNACVLNITASGEVSIIVNGYSLETSSVQISTISSESGETVSVDNPLITSQDRAIAVGKWVETYMRNRMTLSSSWRADPRLDALDTVDNENDYGSNKVIMTKVDFTYNGAFRGSGEGRVI